MSRESVERFRYSHSLYAFAVATGRRADDLNAGRDHPRIESRHTNPVLVAIEEIASGLVHIKENP